MLVRGSAMLLVCNLAFDIYLAEVDHNDRQDRSLS